MPSIETGIVLLEMLGSDTKVPIVLRVQGRALSTAVNQRFGFENVRSTVDLAAPWFIGAAMGCMCWARFGSGNAPSWSAECWWRRTASWMEC